MKDCLRETWKDPSLRECPAVSAWMFLLPPCLHGLSPVCGSVG